MLVTAIPAASATPATPAAPQVRVNQVGYPVSGPKVALVMLAKPFNTTTAGYEDNVVSWPSVEPADDYTATSLFAFALGGAGLD